MRDAASLVYVVKGVLVVGAMLGLWALYWPYRRR